ncbi:MAG TPA: type II toxin-antitoxin system VapC family toxin [Lacipirellulaceae bacterium]|nr:type II toxin-antitoxin system VapC family toxin [Lacipirellulaceae bacterium]
MPFLYVETSIVSYLRQRTSGQVVAAARQVLTRRWWDKERTNYDLVVSQYVLDEVSDGDPQLASERLELLEGLPLLELNSEIDDIAEEIMARAILPANAQLDALHIACAAHHRIDYLLTWNCKHIANARILPIENCAANEPFSDQHGAGSTEQGVGFQTPCSMPHAPCRRPEGSLSAQ